MKFLRILCYAFLVLIAGGWAIVLALVISACRPEPGADMVLMGLPVVGLPMIALGGILLIIISTAAGRSMRPWERWLFGLSGGSTFAVFLLVWLLG